MADLFDVDNPAHAMARTRLGTDLIAWLVTTSREGRPHPAPVWFLWHDGVITILSEPDTLKVRHLERGSQAVLHLDSGGAFGDDIVVLHGDVRLEPNGASAWLQQHREPYEEKYRAAIAAYGMPLDQFGQTFTTRVEFTPTRVVAWGK
ncbi:pyridoxamine 5'-phosphate oxidase family protein [Microbacterium sp. zg.Y1090]|uniref:pyridoxamine 5'-phosphate oxidase family protein n=1 Tax=Microbacterium TaxID=33882 RepID=UPI00214C2F23|nr:MULTISPECIES: pyridoxamine 5'-phosphate oxidase family protein [unclassified Microbacterium]MCR2812965.1 pyridoxamine 5'-phosphate oxidase family protein [Microbacterium sp. zg.Y1084]MCR2817225.1 pyridoxamine 5'-phosphate oxidase family protein [Microbacterium sp. zg.Y1090]MDL5486106.1 pyridoxamine 5'-phosphate oxidase family protein [Microbacterium sp. zg-Y1211]WIM29284.1 pyridoxamine 5'-phosphate oxidase family protein [Microbacterium sp. zg-Y1090]